MAMYSLIQLSEQGVVEITKRLMLRKGSKGDLNYCVNGKLLRPVNWEIGFQQSLDVSGVASVYHGYNAFPMLPSMPLC